MNYFKLIESIRKHEGFSSKVYTCPTGKLTIGYGRNLEDNGITEREALELLNNDIQSIKEDLKIQFSYYEKMPDHVQNVLIEMAYQIGVNGLMKFTKTLKFLRWFDYESASKEMLNSKWANQTPNRALELSNLMKGGF